MIKEIILLDKKKAFSKLPSIISDNDICYYLSKDYESYLKLNEIVSPRYKVLNLKGRFNKEIKRLRTGYLNLFADLSKKYNSLEWWCTPIASRNSMSIPLQSNIAYLFCAKNIIEELSIHENVTRAVFIADSQALLDSIALLGKKRKLHIYQPNKMINKLVISIKIIFLYVARIFIFIWFSYKNRKSSFSILKPLSHDSFLKKKIIVLRSWITKGTLNEDGLYIDRNFGILPDELKSKGYEVMILPMFFNLNNSLKEIYSLIKLQNHNFLIQDHYLKYIDYFKAIILEWKQLRIPLKNISLENLDLTQLFSEDRDQQGFGMSTSPLYMCYFWLKRIKDLGFEIDRFYYPFENNMPEKPMIIGCKKYFPESEVIAYQHSVWFDNQLGMFLGDGESEYHPIADKIICSGPIYPSVLKNANFPEKKIFLGPNLRFAYVHKSTSKCAQDIIRPNILLPLTMLDDLAYDLIHKVKIVSKNFKDLFVYIRTHPAINKKKLVQFINQIGLTNYQFADENKIQDWLVNTDMVISSCSSVSILETVAMNVPLIRVIPDNCFFLDPLEWSNYPIKPVNCPEEISICIKSILDMTIKDRDKFKGIGSNILHNYFTKIHKDNLEIFY